MHAFYSYHKLGLQWELGGVGVRNWIGREIMCPVSFIHCTSWISFRCFFFPLQFGRSSDDERDKGTGVFSGEKRREQEPHASPSTPCIRSPPVYDSVETCARALLGQDKPCCSVGVQGNLEISLPVTLFMLANCHRRTSAMR